ncbi:unnamed protein product [Vitrella brassicaformis CCMP3155]|uniref:Apple domain-containing protein n=3 Tax=Vitrella brassicaformis TaxID=1169539 RepID=A0A0G4FK32_VITBC|nr:unnamed protein product [Vitrella brassicaformis CCMP3155]|eukprot:CEM14069.1 unnamed protein product [Vitrella brassicaformis CCMP3155]
MYGYADQDRVCEGSGSGDCSTVTVAPPPDASCYEWDTVFEGEDLSEPVNVTTIGLEDKIGETPAVGFDVNALGHIVQRPYDCQRGCQVYEQCKAWTFSRKEGCFFRDQVQGRRDAPEEESEGGDVNWYVSGDKFSTDGDKGSLVSPCYEYNMACLYPTSRHHHRQGVENVTTEQCHDLCREIPGCRAFLWLDRYPRDEKIVRGVCYFCGQKDRKICRPGAIMGWVESRDCGPPQGMPWPPPPLPPLTEDGVHLQPADPSLYFGLPLGPDSLAAGKKGTKEERSYQRGDLGIPPFLLVALNYPVRPLELEEAGTLTNCGCYHAGVQPAPGSTLITDLDVRAYAPSQCQDLCVEEPECEAFSSTKHKCLLWKYVTEWRLDQVEPIVVSGPRLCPATLIDQGYACNLDHYRAKYSSLSLLLLKIPGLSMPYGQSCPAMLSPWVFAYLAAVCGLVFAAFAYTRRSKKQYPNTVVWRVVVAVVAGLGTVTHVVFVGYLFRIDYRGVIFWAACAHLLAMVFFNEITVVLYNLKWVTRHESYALTFRRKKREPPKDKSAKPADATCEQAEQPAVQPAQPLKKSATLAVLHAAPEAVHQNQHPPATFSDDTLVSYCPSFAFSALSSEAVFGNHHAAHNGDMDLPDEVVETTLPVHIGKMPRPSESCPATVLVDLLAIKKEGSTDTTKSEQSSEHAVVRLATIEEERDEHEFGGTGAGLVFVLFSSFFSIGVLHMCWSHFRHLPFFGIAVKSEAFLDLEMLALVGYVPMLIFQLLTVFLSSSFGGLADVVPPVTLAAILLAGTNIGGVLVRFVRGKCMRRSAV